MFIWCAFCLARGGVRSLAKVVFLYRTAVVPFGSVAASFGREMFDVLVLSLPAR